VKKNERRAIIEHLGPELGKVEFEAQMLRGRKLDEAKLNRWMKLEKVNFEESPIEEKEAACVQSKFHSCLGSVYLTDIDCEANVIPFKQDFGPANQDPQKPPPTQISNYEEQSEFDSQVQGSQKVSVLQYNDYSFDWNSVDVLGSPGLTKLIGALTIEECDVPFLDLSSDSLGTGDIEGSDLLDLCSRGGSAQGESIVSRMQSWSKSLSSSIDTSQTSEKLWISTNFPLHSELNPFPTSSSQSYHLHPKFFRSGLLKPTLSESECKNKLQRLKRMQETEIIHLTETMGAIAEDYYDQDCFETAETWFRRIVRAKQLVNWYKPHQTLWVCLRVALCLRYQGPYKEAHQLLQGLHGTIERTLAADHEISVQSKILNGDLLGHLGFWSEEEDVHRQILQIRLNSLGMRHPETIMALQNLGYTLKRLARHGEAQNLLETSLHFLIGTLKNLGDYSVAGTHVLSCMHVLAETLNDLERYDESENVLDFARNLLGDVTRRDDWHGLDYHLEKARTYRFQKRFEKSEKILRGLLKYHLNAMAPDTTMVSMYELAHILEETGRYREAVNWRKKEYLLHVKTFGLIHRWTMDWCEGVGFLYADQSRYQDGKLFFEEVIEMLALSNEESDSRAACIQKIKTWMEKLEEMRLEDSRESSAETSDSMDSSSEPIESKDEVEYEDMSDVPDPLDY
jgi:tetratricopeptide (TPR) repeat protein